MTTAYEIPTKPYSERFNISLNNVIYQILKVWNVANQSWIIDISDSNGNPILSGVPLITGADLLDQYRHLLFGGEMECQTDHNLQAVPTYDNMGSESHLYWLQL